MNVKKAVITAAGRSQRNLPLQTLVDRDGQEKAALQILVEEVFSAEIEDICIVVCPGDGPTYAQAVGDYAGKLRFVEQAKPLGYGHALAQAKNFTEREPFLHLVSDHLYLSTSAQSCARQLVEVAQTESCSISAVQASRESMLPYYGIVGGRRVPASKQLYEVEHVLEKPTPTEAEQRLIVPGLRAGHYLCLFGMHVLMPSVMNLLEEAVGQAGEDGGVQLSPCLDRLADQERYLAFEAQGLRYNMGMKYGMHFSQMALALAGKDREEILAQWVELLATRERAAQ